MVISILEKSMSFIGTSPKMEFKASALSGWRNLSLGNQFFKVINFLKPLFSLISHYFFKSGSMKQIEK